MPPGGLDRFPVTETPPVTNAANSAPRWASHNTLTTASRLRGAVRRMSLSIAVSGDAACHGAYASNRRILQTQPVTPSVKQGVALRHRASHCPASRVPPKLEREKVPRAERGSLPPAAPRRREAGSPAPSRSRRTGRRSPATPASHHAGLRAPESGHQTGHCPLFGRSPKTGQCPFFQRRVQPVQFGVNPSVRLDFGHRLAGQPHHLMTLEFDLPSPPAQCVGLSAEMSPRRTHRCDLGEGRSRAG